MNSKKPLVSVIIPAYNCENTIETAILSCFSQNLDFEIIIVDDASNDQTVKKASQFISTGKVNVFYNQKNMGPSAARNIAIRKATGMWIAQLDSDDWFAPNRLKSLINIANEQNADSIADDLFIVENKSFRIISTLFKETSFPYDSLVKIRPKDFIAHKIGPIKPLIKREFIKKKNIYYPEDYYYGEDFLFVLKLLLSGLSMIIVPNPGYYLRRGDTGSLTTNRINLYRQLLKSADNLINSIDIQNNSDLLSEIKKMKNYREKLLKSFLINDYFIKRQYNKIFKSFVDNPSLITDLFKRVIEHSLLKLRRINFYNDYHKANVPQIEDFNHLLKYCKNKDSC